MVMLGDSVGISDAVLWWCCGYAMVVMLVAVMQHCGGSVHGHAAVVLRHCCVGAETVLWYRSLTCSLSFSHARTNLQDRQASCTVRCTYL